MLVGASLLFICGPERWRGDPAARFRALFAFIWAGFVINLITGAVLFVTQAADRVQDPVFGLKLCSIGLALWTGVVLRRRVIDAPDGAPPDRASPRPCGGGLALWAVAIVTGRLWPTGRADGIAGGGLRAWIEATALSKALFDITWLWPLCECLHFLGLAVLIGGAGLLDLRLWDSFAAFPSATSSVHAVRDRGFAVNATTGVLFLTMQPHLYLGSGICWVKVGFIALAGLNAMFFETRLSQPALALAPDADTPLAMKVIGGLSLFSWFAVLYCGRMLPYLGTGN